MIRGEQKVEMIKNHQKTKWSRFFNYINKVFTKLGVSYRWVDLETYGLEFISKEEVRDFLFYFLITYQHKIQDYYFD